MLSSKELRKNIKTEHVETRRFKWEIIVCLMVLRGCQSLSGFRSDVYRKEALSRTAGRGRRPVGPCPRDFCWQR